MEKEPIRQEPQQEMYYQGEQGVTFMQVMGVLFGRKILFLIVTLSLFFACTVGILVYNHMTSTYEGMYNYYVTGLSEGKYIDGSRFDVRDLVTLEKLEQYKSEHTELANLNMNSVYYNGVIKSLKYETIYKANPAKMNDDDDAYVVDKAGYKIIFSKNSISQLEAQVLTKAIAEEANVITQQIVENADYTQYLTLYTQSRIYENQIAYLEGQYDLINNKYANLIEQYGDILLADGMRLSDCQLVVKEYFQNVSFEALRSELSLNGYVIDYTDYEMQINKQIDALTREKAVDIAKKDELISQRDALLAAAGSLFSVELSVYNDKIIELTNRIFDIDNELELLQLKLTNKGREQTDPEYAADLTEFKAALADHSEALASMTNDYTKYEKEVVKKYSVVYYDSNSVVTKQNGINLIMFFAIGAIGSIAVAMIVNLVLDGKKLTREYHKEQENNK